MNRDATGPALSAIFVDYDNIYMSLKRRNEEAAKRFSKDAALWIRELESGRLITSTGNFSTVGQRRIVLNRCYGNPMPRRNSHDNSTDMNSFPFVRHHFLRSGSEVIDCPPLTAQLKNSADIRIVMDVRDMISHDTYFDEFIILSGDADFTPLLHRLRAHARRTVIYANDHTAQPYTAISDGEVRESDLLRLLLEGSLTQSQLTNETQTTVINDVKSEPIAVPAPILRQSVDLPSLRREIVAEIATLVKSAGQPVPLEALADRLVRQLGHDKTAGSGWGGMGGFRDLLTSYLPEEFRLSAQAPFVVFEVARMLPAASVQASEPVHRPEPVASPAPQLAQRLDRTPPIAQRAMQATTNSTPAAAPTASLPPLAPTSRLAEFAADRGPSHTLPLPVSPRTQPDVELSRPQPVSAPISAAAPSQVSSTQRGQVGTQAMAIQQAVARIYEACQAPPLSPPEYRAVFDVIAQEINLRGLTGAPTLDNIVGRAKELGIELRRDDVRFLLDVVSESDPWFEQGASANLFASRFRNFVVARCRSHGLALTADELDLIEHWFAGAASQPVPPVQAAAPQTPQRTLAAPQAPTQSTTAPAQGPAASSQWWSLNEPQVAETAGPNPPTTDDFPRIIRSRMRG